MSGGAYNYTYMRVLDFAEALESGQDIERGEGEARPLTPLRLAFATHLRKVAEALRAIEWEDSGDGADDNGEMMAVLLNSLPSDEAIAEGFRARVERLRGRPGTGVKDIQALLRDLMAFQKLGFPLTDKVNALDIHDHIESLRQKE